MTGWLQKADIRDTLRALFKGKLESSLEEVFDALDSEEPHEVGGLGGGGGRRVVAVQRPCISTARSLQQLKDPFLVCTVPDGVHRQ